MSINVGILFQEEETRGMDLTTPEAGNPGVGGTAFCFLHLISYFEKNITDIDMKVYQFQNNILPTDKVTLIEDNEALSAGENADFKLKKALDYAKQDGRDIILLRNHQTDTAYEILKQYDFKYIFWMHNKLTYNEIVMFRKWDNVKRVIAVGRQMYDYYVDDFVITKLDYVVNPFVPPSKDKIRDEILFDNSTNVSNNVTYVGSLTYDKNFHMLAAAWKDILSNCPEAKLHVIGSGRLYDKNSKLGKYGHAEESYEEMFMPALTDENGNTLESVVFHGIMGNDKYDVFKNTAVGVINPMATETFGLAAIEMEACGVPIVSRRKNGLPDSVEDGKSGILYKNVGELADTIVKLFKDRELNIKMGKEACRFARNDFLPEIVFNEWIQIFEQVSKDKVAQYKKPVSNFDNNGKRFRCILHALHSCILFRWLPSIHDLQKK